MAIGGSEFSMTMNWGFDLEASEVAIEVFS